MIEKLKLIGARLWEQIKANPVVVRTFLAGLVSAGYISLTDAQLNAVNTLVVTIVMLVGVLSARGRVEPVATDEDIDSVITQIAKVPGAIKALTEPEDKEVTVFVPADHRFRALWLEAKGKRGGVRVSKGAWCEDKNRVFECRQSYTLAGDHYANERPSIDRARWKLIYKLPPDASLNVPLKRAVILDSRNHPAA